MALRSEILYIGLEGNIFWTTPYAHDNKFAPDIRSELERLYRRLCDIDKSIEYPISHSHSRNTKNRQNRSRSRRSSVKSGKAVTRRLHCK